MNSEPGAQTRTLVADTPDAPYWTGFFNTRASGVTVVVCLLIAWELSARLSIVQSENWPAFTSILIALWSGLADGELTTAAVSSLWRMCAGYLLGGLAGIIVGIFMARLKMVRRTLEPTIELMRPLPAVAIIPPLIFLVGVDDAFKITIVAFAVFFPILVNAMSGALSVDPVYLQVAHTFKTPRSMVLRKVILPATMPYLLAGMRISLAIALIVTVVAEMTAGSDGIGYHLLAMQYALRSADMYAAVILLAIIGYVLNRGFLAIEAKVIHWARQSERLATG